MIIQVFQLGSTFHLARSIQKAGIASISVKAYCDDKVESDEGVEQLPQEFYKHLCADCKAAFEDIKSKAG